MNSLADIKKKIYEMLIYFDKICQEHSLTYYLSYGTLLGAVRHSGFIPWDDDIDIAMPRKDYDWLIAHYQEILPSTYDLQYYKNTPNYHLNFAKIVDNQTTVVELDGKDNYRISGAYIDIFPIDGAGNSYKEAIRWRKKASVHIKLNSWACYSKEKIKGKPLWIRLIIRLVQVFINGNKAKERTENFFRKRPYDKNKYVSIFADLGKVMNKDIYGNPIKLKFNDHYFNAPCLPEEYLVAEYGEDYMQLPPEGERRQHEFVYLDLSLPFQQFDIKMLDELNN